MSMNAHHCCIVFTNSYDVAKETLDRINKMKGNLISIRDSIHSGNLRYYFEDEEWVWINPELASRGYRGHKVYIDLSLSDKIIQEVIHPLIAGYCNLNDIHVITNFDKEFLTALDLASYLTKMAIIYGNKIVAKSDDGITLPINDISYTSVPVKRKDDWYEYDDGFELM